MCGMLLRQRQCHTCMPCSAAWYTWWLQRKPRRRSALSYFVGLPATAMQLCASVTRLCRALHRVKWSQYLHAANSNQQSWHKEDVSLNTKAGPEASFY